MRVRLGSGKPVRSHAMKRTGQGWQASSTGPWKAYWGGAVKINNVLRVQAVCVP